MKMREEQNGTGHRPDSPHHSRARYHRLESAWNSVGYLRPDRFGSLRAHVDAGKLSERTLHAELGEIVAGRKPGRESARETILFWHRGLSISDIALGQAMLEKARRLGLGQQLQFA